jgi:GGDEF domain-containing protein
MAASDQYPHSSGLPPDGVEGLARDALRERLDEEISRAERQGTQLSCLLVVIENLGEMTREHGAELREQTLEYVAGALRRELRRFDRIGQAGREGAERAHDLLIILPGADGPRAEIVGRRALQRMRTIKVEAQGTRWPLEVTVGLAAWRADVGASELLAQAYAAVGGAGAQAQDLHAAEGVTALAEGTRAADAHGGGEVPPAVGHAGRS